MYPHTDTSWLLAANVAVGRATAEGPGYDLRRTASFWEFALSMVMGHAPIIFPAVVRRPIPYHWSMGRPSSCCQSVLVRQAGTR